MKKVLIIIALVVGISSLLGCNGRLEETGSWEKYENEAFLFSVNYPAAWKSVQLAPHAIGFRPPSMPENSVQWAVIVRDEKPETFEEIISEMGKEFKDTRTETRQHVILNGREVWHIIVTTSEKPTWRHEQVLVRSFNKIYIITNGAIKNDDFDLFWRSFKIVPPK